MFPEREQSASIPMYQLLMMINLMPNISTFIIVWNVSLFGLSSFISTLRLQQVQWQARFARNSGLNLLAKREPSIISECKSTRYFLLDEKQTTLQRMLLLRSDRRFVIDSSISLHTQVKGRMDLLPSEVYLFYKCLPHFEFKNSYVTILLFIIN